MGSHDTYASLRGGRFGYRYPELALRGSKGYCVAVASEDLDVEVYSLDGVKLAERHTSDGRLTIDLPAGLYLVRANGTMHKVIVE